jgi:hypothetical protein
MKIWIHRTPHRTVLWFDTTKVVIGLGLWKHFYWGFDRTINNFDFEFSLGLIDIFYYRLR